MNATINIATQEETKINLKMVAVSFATGFVNGALAMSPLKGKMQAVINTGVSVASYVAECSVKKEKVDPVQLGINAGFGYIFGRGNGMLADQTINSMSRSMDASITNAVRYGWRNRSLWNSVGKNAITLGRTIKPTFSANSWTNVIGTAMSSAISVIYSALRRR